VNLLRKKYDQVFVSTSYFLGVEKGRGLISNTHFTIPFSSSSCVRVEREGERGMCLYDVVLHLD
jgi:hypothetical protein